MIVSKGNDPKICFISGWRRILNYVLSKFREYLFGGSSHIVSGL